MTEITHNAVELKDALELWRVIIDSIPIKFFAKDADSDFRYVLCNQAFADFVGKTPQDIIGKTDAELFASSVDTSALHREDIETISANEAKNYDETFVDAAGKQIHCQIVKMPFISAEGKRLLMGAFTDITERVHLTECERLNSEMLAYAVGEQDFKNVLEYIAERLQHRMECTRIILTKCNDDGLLRLDREWISDGQAPLHKRGLERHYQLWDKHLSEIKSNKTLYVSDLGGDDRFDSLDLNDSYKNAAMIATPILINNQLWGSLFVVYPRQKRTYSNLDEAVMRSCASVIALSASREKQAIQIRQYEHETRMILNNIDIPIALHNASGKLLRVNSATCKMTGRPEQQLLDAPEGEIFYIGKTPPQDSPLKQVISGKAFASANLKVGSKQYIGHADAASDPQGNLLYIVKSAVDVTALNTLIENRNVINFCLETLLRERDMQKAISAALQAVCLHIGASRAYIFQFNTTQKTISSFIECAAPGREQVFAKTKDQPYAAKPDWEARFATQKIIASPDLLSDPFTEELGPAWQQTIQHYSMRSAYSHRIMMNSKFWGYVGIVYEEKPYEMNKSDLEFISSVAHFIEAMLERWNIQNQLMDAVTKARSADLAKSSFIAGVSHEIRTPLNAVIGFAELLRSGNVSEQDQKEYVNNISYSGNALLDLINDVLDLSKLEADQMVITPEATDFAKLGKDVLNVFAFRATERLLELKSNIPDLPDLFLDQQRVRQILFNLIGNAAKFTDHGSITLQVSFDIKSDRFGTFEFAVIDTGIGVSPEDQKLLMKPFVQVSNARSSKTANTGTGLGLSISKRLAEKMGGVLWLKSELGKGSTFGVTLHNVEYRHANQTPAEPIAPIELGSAVKDLSILLVDDVEMNLKVLKAICNKLGVNKITCASSGHATLELLKTTRFNLVLTDVWMPDMNGTELLKKIREDSKFDRLQIAAVTADSEAPTNAGFAHVLLKPLTVEKVQKFLNSISF